MATQKKSVKKSSSKKAPAKGTHTASELVDEQLERYRSMRDFAVTGEPSGQHLPRNSPKNPPKGSKAAEPPGLPFVIQKHAATRLHYDFRLGWNGVLKSWAVTKGPSYVTRDKRLAVQVEDHPMDYGGFEGIIPKGQYGGGTVMLWDTGTWEPQAGHTDVDAGLRDGSLKFILHGTKMKGKWALVRMGGKAAGESKPNWLLIKEHDDFERGPEAPAITEESLDSVLTHRTMDEIARQEDHVWNSKGAVQHPKPGTDKGAPPLAVSSLKAGKQSRTAPATTPPIPSPNSPKEPLPAFIPPQLATQSDTAPQSSGPSTWIHELKLDGYRIQARKDQTRKGKDKIQLLTRTGLDWTHRMPSIAAELARLGATAVILDGEVVVLGDDGLTSFANLQAAFKDGARHPLTYFIFDLLHLNGRNLRLLPLTERKQILSDLLAAIPGGSERLRLSEHLETSGSQVFQKACDLHAEGIVSKLASAPYISGRSRTWLKIKCGLRQEFVIGGFTLPSNGMHGVGALLLGYYDDQGRLLYAGRTGTGFTQKLHAQLRTQLEKLEAKAVPFVSIPSAAGRGVHWVAPKLVAEVAFATWTADNLVRQAAFQGLREDKAAKDVRRETPSPVETVDPAPTAAHSSNSGKAAKSLSSISKRKDAPPSKVGKQPPQPATDRSPSPRDSETPSHAPIRLTHPEKVVDTESKLTKQQLADYYWQIAPHLLPHIVNRPISLVRCPEGSTQPCFFQKHTSTMLPPGVETVPIRDKKSGKPEPYITLSTPEALAGLGQMGVLEVHPWGSQNDNLEHPDRIIFDLDPDEAVGWAKLAASAKDLRALLKKLGLESFLKSTGGKGLHLVLPIVPEHDWADVKEFAHSFALFVEKNDPAHYVSKMSKAARTNRIFLDYLRNERGATAVAPFSPRARAGAPVSVPLAWSELDRSERPVFTVAGFPEWRPRLKRDPWKKLPETRQSLDLEKAASLLK